MSKNTNIIFRLTIDEKEVIKKLAQYKGMSVTKLIDYLLNDELNKVPDEEFNKW